MTKDFDEFIQYRALAFKFGNTDFEGSLDMVLDDGNEAEKLKIKNVCAKISIQLADELEETCAVLRISKRKFIELAIIEALVRCDSIVKEFDIYAPYTKSSEVSV